MKAILNASPIIAFFDELRDSGKLLLLRSLDYELIVPDHVWRHEIVKEPSSSVLAECIREGSVLVMPPPGSPDVEDFLRNHPALGPGESEVILNALSLRAAGEEVVCILDEGPARGIAGQLGLRVTGTLGLILTLRESGLITEDEERRLRNGLRSSTFRMSDDLLR